MPPLLNTTIGHLRRLATLDLEVFDDLRFDPAATLPAILVAVVSMALLGIGGWLWWVTTPGLGDDASVFLKTVILGTIFGAGAWLAWLLVIYAVLRQLSRLTVPMEQLLRTAGFAAAPLVLALGMVIPSISFGIGLLALAAWVATTQVAVERTIGRGGGDVLAANLAGFAVWAIVMSLLATGSNQIGPGPFLAESIWDAIAGQNITFG